MESALTPREIQARIRGGESLTRVAELAGVPVEQIDVYAGPVLAEREHAALLARESQVRRRGESSSQRLLGEVVADNLEAKGVSPDDIRWDAWRDEDRRWTVQASWILDGTERQAHFNFDLRGRVSAAADEQARALINEAPRATGPGGDPDSEPTIDLNDELALVRAVQADTEPPAVVPDQPSARIIKLPGELTRDEEPNDYAPAELEQVDGVYDIIPNPRNDMDVLYDMLAGFNEDSVRIYAGLTQPVSPQPEQRPEPEQVPQAQPPREPEPQAAQTPASMPQSTTPQATMTSRPAATTHPRPKPGPRSKPGPAPRPAPASQPKSTPRPPEPEPTSQPATPPAPQPPPEPEAPEISTPEGSQPAAQQEVEPISSVAESEQDALVGQPAAKPAPRPSKRRKRASVPTWDEIMFGGPQQPTQQ